MKKYSVAETEKKVKKIFTIICDTLELIVAVIVGNRGIFVLRSLSRESGRVVVSDSGTVCSV